KPFGGDHKRSERGDRFPEGDSRRTDRKERPDFKSPRGKEASANPEGVSRRTGKFEKAPEYRLVKKEKPHTKEPKEDDGLIRLNRYISNSGICSRREADELISGGLISVNGKVIDEMGFQLNPGDVVKYGKR